jgi:lipoprotein-anchoring transpeptidase ErfK/SrfK
MTDDVDAAVTKLEKGYGLKPGELAIVVDPSEQKLYAVRSHKVTRMYSVSTSKRGLGNVVSSRKTPTGMHRIKKKIGEGAPLGTIFKARVNTGKVTNNRAHITTRIMWLDGQEPGINTDLTITEDTDTKAGHIDSFWRYIYIHGTGKESRIGTPHSIGCIEMKNEDVVELFEGAREGTLVEILKKPYTGG